MCYDGLGLTLALLPAAFMPQEHPLEKYRRLEFSSRAEHFEKGWKERVVVEFEIVNSADPAPLRKALQDADLYVRSMAARALGIRGDKESAEALAALAETDREPLVRVRAVEALGLLKAKPEVIERAKKDADLSVKWVARLAEGQLKEDTDYAALVREAYAAGINRDTMDSARVRQPAPDFTARTTDGKAFKLSEVLGKKPIAIYFAAFDG
jgi:hypothetical protein